MADGSIASPDARIARPGRAWFEPLAIVATIVLMVVSVLLVHWDQTRDDRQATTAIVMMSAIESGMPDALESHLADYDARLGFRLPQRKGDCLTMLHLAARTGNPRIVRLLVAAGDIPTVRDYKGMTAFEIAVDARQPAVIPALYRDVPAEAPTTGNAATGAAAPVRPWCAALAAALRHGDEATAALVRAHAAPDEDLSTCR
jgi:hypothetical protein